MKTVIICTICMIYSFVIGLTCGRWELLDSLNVQQGRSEDSTMSLHRSKHDSSQFMPFGVGRRVCPGMLLANINTAHILAYLLPSFAWHLPEEHKLEALDMPATFTGVTSPKNILCTSLHNLVQFFVIDRHHTSARMGALRARLVVRRSQTAPHVYNLPGASETQPLRS